PLPLLLRGNPDTSGSDGDVIDRVVKEVREDPNELLVLPPNDGKRTGIDANSTRSDLGAEQVQGVSHRRLERHIAWCLGRRGNAKGGQKIMEHVLRTPR